MWDAFILGGVCFIGSVLEMYQKSAEDDNSVLVTLLYSCDFFSLISIWVKFHSTIEDDQGQTITDRETIARRYVDAKLGFYFDVCMLIPFEVFAIWTQHRGIYWTYLRFPKVLRNLKVNSLPHPTRKLNPPTSRCCTTSTTSPRETRSTSRRCVSFPCWSGSPS